MAAVGARRLTCRHLAKMASLSTLGAVVADAVQVFEGMP